MSLIVNRPYPIKICYLKDQNKQPQQFPQQKVSLTFLSSFIQQQKHLLISRRRQQQQKQQIRDHEHQHQHHNLLFNKNSTQDRIKPRTTVVTTQQKWRNRKNHSQSQDKRLLTNLVGTQWVNENYMTVHENRRFKINKKNNKKTIKQRMETYHNQEIVQENKKLMETHFRNFLSDKKQKPVIIEQPQINCFTTKLDSRTFHSLKPELMLTNLRSGGYHYNNNNSHNNKLNVSESKLHSQKQQPPKSNKTINPNLLKNGFKQMANFKWSKLNNIEKFKLNDHL